MIVIKKLILLIIFISSIISSKGQDINFTQFHTNYLEINPAFTGSAILPRVSLNYRNQWPAISKAFVTYSSSYDQFFEKYKSGVGFKISNDVQGEGIMNFLSFDASYSYLFKLGVDFYCVSAIQAGYGQNNLNLSKAIFANMIDPINGPVLGMIESITGEKTSYVDFASGIAGYFKDHYFGFSVHHITNPITIKGAGLQNVNRKYSINYGYTFPVHINGWVNPHFYISPSVLFQKQGDFDQIIYGTYVDSRPLTYGVWIRQSFNILPNSLVFLLGYKKDNIKVSYSYDLTLSKLIGLTFGTHEIAFVYLIKNNKPEEKSYKSKLKHSWLSF